MIELASDDVRQDCNPTALPEYFCGKTAESFVLGELRSYMYPEVLLTTLRENLLQQWPGYHSQALFSELDRAVKRLHESGFAQVLTGDYVKVRLFRR